MTYKIEKDIPVGQNQKREYPWPEMKVGDSFKAPMSERNAATGSASHYGKKHGVKFTSKSFGKEFRIWRTA